MSEETDATAGWYSGAASGDVNSAARAIRDGEATVPRAWPGLAVESGAARSADEYYEWLHAATVAAAREGIREREQADDRQLIHAVRAMDDCRRTANELAERVAEWGSDRLAETGAGIDYARSVADHEPADRDPTDRDPTDRDPTDRDPTDRDPPDRDPPDRDPTEERLVALAQRCVDLADEADDLRAFIERTAPDVAPNLASMAGPVLASRLIALAGGLESLAKKPSGTVQVLGAEDALFAHLRGEGPSPKHGVIYTHEYVRGTDPDDRGSAARAVAGKFAIAARVDHYGGERKPELDADLDERIARIRERDGDESSAGVNGGTGDDGDHE